MKKIVLSVTLLSATGLFAPAFAGGKHDHGHGDAMDEMSQHDSNGMGMSADSKAMFLEKRSVDGYDVSFHVMQAKPGKQMGGSHDFMIKVEASGKALTDIVMNTKVVHPNGKSETKKTMKMGDWYMAGYDLGHEGEHQLMILFKTADGKKHKSGVYYND